MVELLILGAAFLAHVAWVQVTFTKLRRDLLKVAKNPRHARNALLEERAYKSLEK